MGEFIKEEVWGSGGNGHYTNKDELYLDLLYDKVDNLDNFNILEVGAGTGRFALKLLDGHKGIKYNVLDLEKNINDSVSYLKHRGHNINPTISANYKTLFDKKFDLFIANIVIPETPVDYRIDLLENVIPNCNNAMIISQINLRDQPKYKEWVLKLFADNFKSVSLELTEYKNCHALIGKNLV